VSLVPSPSPPPAEQAETRPFLLGVVCGSCEACSPFGAQYCPFCGRSLRLIVEPIREVPAISPFSATETAPPNGLLQNPSQTHLQPPGFRRPSEGATGSGPQTLPVEGPPQEELMDQAKYYVCTACMTPVPRGHKFCGRCGAPIPEDAANLRVRLFSDMQNPEKARLLLIRGDGADGLSYHLKADQHLVGRQGQIEFPEDVFVSPRHANLFYRDGKLVVRDEASLNGVYFRVRGTVELMPGDTFMAGEQLFRLDPAPKPSDGADTDGTFFYSSPKYPSSFRLTQVLEGGSLGMAVCARGTCLVIGREDGDLNFPGDVYMSAKHSSIEDRGGHYFLTDHESRNGTYVRIKSEQPLGHGDYLFIGRKLLRVELNVN
jgi:pSer/pThr/pTyr-binding forkhead associated (FHA) protein